MFDRICRELHLGTLTAPPKPLHGGYMHRMFRVDTNKGCYALKLLNPEVMRRSDALANFRRAEQCEALLEAANLPILPALAIGGKKMQQVDGRYLYLFDYFDGRALREDEITPVHSAKMGETLAHIHAVDRRTRTKNDAPLTIDWPALADALSRAADAQPEAALLRDALPMLTRVTAAMTDAVRRLPPVEALCHNDMDVKNVLWQEADFRIIDLECLGYANPMQEMMDLAIAWAGRPVREGCFRAFAHAYQRVSGEPIAHPDWLFDSRRNDFDWLAYSIRRAGFDDAGERSIGREQIRKTIGKIGYDQCIRPAVLSWLGFRP